MHTCHNKYRKPILQVDYDQHGVILQIIERIALGMYIYKHGGNITNYNILRPEKGPSILLWQEIIRTIRIF